MNSINNNEDASRPFGFWLKAVDRLMAAEFAAAFESFGVTRREWRLMNRIDGTVASDRPLPAHKIGRLVELGWVTDADGGWALTDEGRAAKKSLGDIVDGIRAKVTDAVPAEDLATTMATLEKLARAFGWDESTPLPRGGGRGHRHGGRGHGRGGYGHGHGRGHGRGGYGRHGFGPKGFGPGQDGSRFDEHDGCRHPFDADFDHGHGRGHGRPGYEARGDEGHGRGHARPGHAGHGRARVARFAQASYERGFDAGFARGHRNR